MSSHCFQLESLIHAGCQPSQVFRRLWMVDFLLNGDAIKIKERGSIREDDNDRAATADSFRSLTENQVADCRPRCSDICVRAQDVDFPDKKETKSNKLLLNAVIKRHYSTLTNQLKRLAFWSRFLSCTLSCPLFRRFFRWHVSGCPLSGVFTIDRKLEKLLKS